MGEDWNFYAAPSQDGKAALVSAASGIGDILRITPLIRVFARLGYQVDVLLAPDYPEAITLLEGAPEIRRLFYRPSSWSGEKQQRLDGLNREFYDVAAFTILSLALQKFVRARRTFSFQRAQWLQEGDSACVETLAKEAGWEGPLPKPFVIPANRQFDL
ncbi:MAG: glycosyltransferase family 9 protein, partial [Gammaproteobacteria bacterium]|nr:glycosyltransferase family 9 protein [Gammaproteobacteria bacterium]